MSKSKQVLITGGAGFVGSALGLGFAQRYPNSQITALDNLKRRGSELNLPRLQQAGIQFIHSDIRNVEDIEAIDERHPFFDEPKTFTYVFCNYHPSSKFTNFISLTDPKIENCKYLLL